MKIVCLLGSPRPGGNSATIARHFLKTAEGLGAQTSTFELNRLTYRGCQGCYACKTRTDRCVVQDDLTGVLEAVSDADLLLLATPVYYGDVTGQLKSFIDRTFSFLKPDFHTNPEPARLEPGKTLVFVITQGNQDEAKFADVFPRYDAFLKWFGFAESHLIRACGVSQLTTAEVLAPWLRQAEETAHQVMA